MVGLIRNPWTVSKVLESTYTKHGGEIVLEVTNSIDTKPTKRKFVLEVLKGAQVVCPVTGLKVKAGETCIYLRIKTAGFGTYRLHPSVLADKEDEVIEKHKPTTLKDQLLSYKSRCIKTYSFIDSQSMDLAEQRKVLDNKRKKVGQRLRHVQALLELLEE